MSGAVRRRSGGPVLFITHCEPMVMSPASAWNPRRYAPTITILPSEMMGAGAARSCGEEPRELPTGRG